MEEKREKVFTALNPETFGDWVITRAVSNAMKENSDFERAVNDAVKENYIFGKWGSLAEDDKEANDEVVNLNLIPKGQGRIVARYHTEGQPEGDLERYDTDIYIITSLEMIDERSTGVVTTILFTCEY